MPTEGYALSAKNGSFRSYWVRVVLRLMIQLLYICIEERVAMPPA